MVISDFYYKPFFVQDIYIHIVCFILSGTRRCTKDYDCGKNMECLANICYCFDGFYPEENHCTGNYLQTKKYLIRFNFLVHSLKYFN